MICLKDDLDYRVGVQVIGERNGGVGQDGKMPQSVSFWHSKTFFSIVRLTDDSKSFHLCRRKVSDCTDRNEL